MVAGSSPVIPTINEARLIAMATNLVSFFHLFQNPYTHRFRIPRYGAGGGLYLSALQFLYLLQYAVQVAEGADIAYSPEGGSYDAADDSADDHAMDVFRLMAARDIIEEGYEPEDKKRYCIEEPVYPEALVSDDAERHAREVASHEILRHVMAQ